MNGRMALFLLAVVLAACSMHDNEPLTAHDIAGRVVLESYEVDLTWGYKLQGIYIEGDGTVWSYQYEGPPWYSEKLKLGEISDRDMLNKHKNAKQVGKVDRRQLLDMAQMIKPASQGKITRQHMLEEGSGTMEVAYLHDDKTTYKEVILSGTGGRAASNSSAAARTLIDYLNDVKAEVGAP